MSDEERLIRLAIYAHDLAAWYCLPFWQRIITAKPRMPS